MLRITKMYGLLALFILFTMYESPVVFGQTPNLGVKMTEDVNSNPALSNDRVSAERLIPLLESKANLQKDRLNALHTMYRARNSLSKSEQIQLQRSTRALAQDKQENAKLRANAIWVLGNVGMMLKHEKKMTHQEIAQDNQFLLQVAADDSEDIQVRRLSITAMGNLKMKEAIPVLKALLPDKSDRKQKLPSVDSASHNRPEILRAASIALTELAPDEAVQPVGQVLTETTDTAVFGTAAYALGRTRSRDALSSLVTNRSRLGDNLSVDNAIGSMSDTVINILKNPSDPNIIHAIKATRSLWREEQKAEYTPLLRTILADKTLSIEVRRESLKRLIEDADMLTLDLRKQRILSILPLVEAEKVFQEEVARMRLILNAQILPILNIESQEGRTAR